MSPQQLTGLLFYGDPDPQWPELPAQPHGYQWVETLRAPSPDGRTWGEWALAAVIALPTLGYLVWSVYR